MQIGNGFFSTTPTDIGVNRLALNGTGTDEGHFNNEVVEAARLHARQGRHLRARLNLKETHRVGLTEKVVDRRLLRQGAEVNLHATRLGNHVHRAMQGLEHAETEEVELHQSNRRTVIFVPLQHRAAGGAGPLHRADLHNGSIANHHARGVQA